MNMVSQDLANPDGLDPMNIALRSPLQHKYEITHKRFVLVFASLLIPLVRVSSSRE